MKKLVVVFLACVFAVALVAGNAAAATIMRLAETHPPDYPTTKGDYEFARLVKERSGGRISVEVYHSKQLGEEKAVIEQVQLGAIDMTRVSISVMAAFVRDLDALQLPYLYRDADHMWKVLNGRHRRRTSSRSWRPPISSASAGSNPGLAQLLHQEAGQDRRTTSRG